VILYEQLGAGRSDIPTDTTLWRIPRFTDELDSLRPHLGLTEIHLLGHSWGTILGTEYVLARPSGVRSLILASPALSILLWESDADSLICTLPDSMQQAIAAAEASGAYEGAAWDAAVHEFYGRFLSRVGGPVLDTTFAHFGAGLYGYMWGPSEFTAVGTLKGYDITPRLGELQLPVFYVMGEFDEILRSTLESYRAATPGATSAIVTGSGHLMSIDTPEAFTAEISRFLKSVEQRR
jgi:proline iminopeptidase